MNAKTTPFVPKHPDGVLRVVAIGRISTPHQDEDSIEASHEYVRTHLERVHNGPTRIEAFGEQASALSIAIPMMAQEKKAAKGKAAKLSPTARVMLRMGKLREALGGFDLTAEQKEKLDKVREEFRPKMGEAFGKLRDILTEEQRTAAEEAARKAREAGKEGRDLMLAVESSLKLTDEQKEKTDKVGKEVWLPLSREMTKKLMAILTPEQKEKVKKAMAPKGRKERKPGDKKDKPRDKKKPE